MVDLLADLVIPHPVSLAGEGEVVAREVEPLGDHEVGGRHRGFQLGDQGVGCGDFGIAFAHHHPADVFEHRFVVLVGARGLDPDHAGLAVGILLEADHLALRPQGVARIDRSQPAPFGIAEVGDGVERDVGDGLAEDQVEGGEIVERRGGEARGAGELVGGIERMAGRVERMVERPLAPRDGARHRMGDDLADAVVFEEASGVGLGHARGSPVGVRRRCRGTGCSRATGGCR